MKKATVAFSALMLLLSGWVMYMTLAFRKSIIAYDIGPAVYPRLICCIIIALSVLLVILDCMVKKDDAPLRFLSWTNVAHIAIIFAFLAALQFVGFPICAFAVLAIMMKIMGCPKLWQILCFSAAASAVLYLVFKLLLNVRLPLGLLEYVF